MDNTTLNTPHQAVLLLIFCLITDFITGVIASWTENNKKSDSPSNKENVIKSAKLRLTAIKFVSYSLGILGAWGIETIFLIKKIPSGYISTTELTLTTYVIGFFIAIELYSIFLKNIKRMGFDIIQKSKIIVIEAWKFYKTLKNGPENT